MNRDGPWIALDVGLLRHRKLEELGRSAPRLLYIACLLHCGDELTDGYVRAGAMPRLLLEAGARRDGRANDVRELERAGLLEPVHGGELIPLDDGGVLEIPGPGWCVPTFTHWNPTRAWWERQREGAAERQRLKRERDRTSRHSGDPDAIQSESRANPEPSQVAGELEPEPKPKRSTMRAQDTVSRVTSAVTNAERSGSDETRREKEQKQGTRAQAPQQAAAPLADDLVTALERLQGPDGVPV